MPGPFFAYTYFPIRPVLGLQGQGHAHLRIVGHVLNRRASPLRGRDPTILKQRTWIKEMRGTLGWHIQTLTYSPCDGGQFKARGRLINLELTKGLFLKASFKRRGGPISYFWMELRLWSRMKQFQWRKSSNNQWLWFQRSSGRLTVQMLKCSLQKEVSKQWCLWKTSL